MTEVEHTEVEHSARGPWASRVPSLLVLAVSCWAIAGCASDGMPTDTGNLSRAQSAASSIEAGANQSESGDAAAIDACALIPADDITRLLGVPVAGKSTSTDPKFPPGCMWENPDNYESVSLEIGNPGTASGDTLPEPEAGFPDVTTPGPDGMRFLGPGSLEFAAGGRSNTVQVAVLSMLSGEKANDAAVELARKVGPQLPE
jgi:hypothetical protein